jgi:DNA-binding NtrC family response regulator
MRPNLKLIASDSFFVPGKGGAPGAKPGNGTHRKPTILIVEDEVVIRLNVGQFLRDSNYRVLEAANAAEAKSILESKEPVELVFTDVQMPGDMNGFELAQWIRRQYPDVSILLTSGMSSLPQAPGYGREHGPVVQKPYTFETVLTHIKRLLLA